MTHVLEDLIERIDAVGDIHDRRMVGIARAELSHLQEVVKDVPRLRAIEAAARESRDALDQYLFWGPMTQSDRYLCEEAMRKAKQKLDALLETK